jgi:hypothetical protein
VTPFLKALKILRREASRQGEFPEHVATIIAMIDQSCRIAGVFDNEFDAFGPLSGRSTVFRAHCPLKLQALTSTKGGSSLRI